ncbi:MAG: aconitate hydratase AcnA [Rickettsiaceae bacterium]
MNRNYKLTYAKKIIIDNTEYTIFDIEQAAKDHDFAISSLPHCLRVLLENVVRNACTHQSINSFKNWIHNKTSTDEVDYFPTRVLMQDFTGVPAIVDLASMRDAMIKMGGDPLKINPMIPVDLVIDHSIQVDSYGKQESFTYNVTKELERNKERYQFLKWGQESFKNLRVVPPGTGICHQVNLEYLAQVMHIEDRPNGKYAYPDTLVGTDSHTTMINSLSVLGWGVGGIEAEAAMLGQALPMILPEVIGFKLTGKMAANITATDLVLTVTQMLRQQNVVGKFVEFFGSGLANLSLAERATISNMAPEYGATCGFFPVDNETLKYLKLTGRSPHQLKVIEEYAKIQGMWSSDEQPVYTNVIELDISKLEPSLAGPKRPQDRVSLSELSANFAAALPSLTKSKAGLDDKYQLAESKDKIGHGDIVLAAITSCTNTSNPAVMIAAGLVAKKACELGITKKSWIKTSLAPGSQVVTEYLHKSGLDHYLNQLGFNLVGYGCTTCIGNSGPLASNVEQVVRDKELAVASVLSGNRNFEGRIQHDIKANYLASPPLVVAYAIAGTVNIDLGSEPLAKDKNGHNVYLKDIWPDHQEIIHYMDTCITSEMFTAKYQDVFLGDLNWQGIATAKSEVYNWQESSTYIKNPPYFVDIDKNLEPLSDINNASILALFGDSITTDHISPAGIIAATSPAGQFLINRGVSAREFNSYGARRGNHEVMMRGTFANPRIKNLMCPGIEGGFTINHFKSKRMSIYDAAMQYQENSIPLVIFAGKEYGTGSSRDWAAKGTRLLGVKAVIAETFERIHRSNLVGMGVLPISLSGIVWQDLNITGDEKVSILGVSNDIIPYKKLQCSIEYANGSKRNIDAILQVFTDDEVEYIKHGGILSSVLYNLN